MKTPIPGDTEFSDHGASNDVGNILKCVENNVWNLTISGVQKPYGRAAGA